MKLWLTRRPNGMYMLTALRPHIAAVRGTKLTDAYIREGEPIGINHLCPDGVKSLFGVELRELESIRIEVFGKIMG